MIKLRDCLGAGYLQTGKEFTSAWCSVFIPVFWAFWDSWILTETRIR